MSNVPYGQRGAATMALRMKKRLELDPADVLKLFAEIDRLNAELKSASVPPAPDDTVLVHRDDLIELVNVATSCARPGAKSTCRVCGLDGEHKSGCAAAIAQRLLEGGGA